jgi:two-component sensor histidine kinase
MRHSSPGEPELAAELNHRINSPLAAIRNALYLAARRSSDPEIRRYLRMADEEFAAIARILRTARAAEAAANRAALARAAVAGSPRPIA